MTVSSQPLRAVGAESLHGNTHYLQAIGAMHRQLRFHTAVYSERGECLAKQGATFDKALYMALVHQHLRRPIDEAITLPDPVDVPSIEVEAMTQCESVLLPRMLMRALGPDRQWQLLAPMSDMAWPVQASFKLTVMRSQRPALYTHSVTMMLVAIYLGACEGLDDAQMALLAPAALLHDSGMLFLDANWIDLHHTLSLDERRQLATHSLTSMQVVREAGYPLEVQMAVLEHHEHMDGSGYPRNAGGEAISAMGRILMLAEVVSAFFDKYAGDLPALRLSLMMRLNRRRYCPVLLGHVHNMLRHAPDMAPPDSQHVAAEVRQSLVQLTMLIEHWKRLREQLPPKWQLLPSGRAGMYLTVRIASLEISLAEAGSLPQQQIAMLHLMRVDRDGLTEQVLINGEALWQLQSFIHTCLRRWPQVPARQDEAAQAVADWIKQAQAVLCGKRPGGRPAFFP